MGTVIPVDEYVNDEWYPGFEPAYDHAPWVVDPVRTFRKQDEETFWFLDFHWPRGMTPMGMIWNEDGYNWGTQLAAQLLPLPPGRGMTSRFAGTHIYGSAIPVTDPREISARTRRISRTLPAFLDHFDEIWADRRDELEAAWRYFRSVDLSTLSLADLGQYLVQARAFHKRAFEIHFEVMYPLSATFVAFHGQCVEFGLDPGEIGTLFQGYDTKIMETDGELWRLAEAARTAGLDAVFAAAKPAQLRQALARHGGAASGWLTTFDDFLQVYGWRTEGTCDVALPSWIEDPTPALGMIKAFLQKPELHDVEAGRRAAVAEREGAIEAARSKLTRQEQEAFDAGLAACTAANFCWWQDDHNYYIDLRVALPMRWACQAIAERVGADAPDDTIFLFWPENMRLVSGDATYAAYRSIVEVRKQYFRHWYERRSSMPKMLGTIPERVDDPILIEIYGLNAHFLDTIRTARPDGSVQNLRGIAASKGKARGIARVLSNADELHRIEPGQILVCESTSPNWTPAFARIAGCICDSGGSLSHAAIVGREYRVPTVTAVAIATMVISDGDEVEVDGTTGTVTVFRSTEAGLVSAVDDVGREG